MSDSRRVTCSECGKRSEIMAPAEDAAGESVVWVCPVQRDDGELCGTTNTTTA